MFRILTALVPTAGRGPVPLAPHPLGAGAAVEAKRACQGAVVDATPGILPPHLTSELGPGTKWRVDDAVT